MPLNSNQVKSPQAGVHADDGGLYLVVRESGDLVRALRFTALDGRRAQMEFARILDSVAGDVLTLNSALQLDPLVRGPVGGRGQAMGALHPRRTRARMI